MTLVRRLQKQREGELRTQKLMLIQDMDIQLQLEGTLDELNAKHHITIITHHVRGHQDKKKKGALTWPEKLNTIADDLASESEFTPKPDHHMLPKQLVSLYANGEEITTGYKKILLQNWSEGGSHSILKYLSEKHKWRTNEATKINWKAVPNHKWGRRSEFS